VLPSTVLEAITDGLMTLDHGWSCTYINPAAAAFFRTKPDDVVGKIIWERFPRLRESRFHEEFTRAVEQQVFVKTQDFYEPLGRWFECRCYPTQDGLAVFFSDTTDNKKVEEAMLESRQVLDMAIAGSEAGIWRIDLNPEKPAYLPDYVYLSPQLKALIGFESDEFPNSRSAWLDRIVPEDRQQFEQAMLAHAEGRTERYETEFRIRHKNGGIRWFISRGMLYRDEFHRPVRWAGIDTDVTDHRLASEMLRRSEQQLRQAHERAAWLARFPQENPNPVLRVSAEGEVLYCNPAAAELSGWACEVGEFLPQAAFKPLIGEAMIEGRVIERDVELNGTPYAVAVAPVPMKCYANIYGRNITERKEAEAALRRSEENARQRAEELSVLMDMIPAAVWVSSDPLCRVITGNRAAKQFYEAAEDENLSAGAAGGEQDFTRRFFRDGRELRPDELPMQEAAVKGMDVRNAELDVLLPSGRTIAILGNASPLFDAEGRIRGAVAAFVDITERKRAEQALWRSNERLRMALEGGRMGLWQWDMEGGHDFWDERVYELQGLDTSVQADFETFFQRVDKGDIEALNEQIRRSIAEDAEFRSEFRITRHGGEVIWVAARGRVVRDASGKAMAMLGVLFDITQRKHMEEQLRRLNDQLEEEVQAQTEEMRDTVDRLQDEVVRRVLAEGKLRKSVQMLEGFFQHTITPLAFMDRHFNFVRVNDAYARADGKTPEFFKGKNHFVLYPHDENRTIFENVVRTGQPHRAHAQVFVYPDKPQQVTYWDWQLTPLCDDRGEVQYLVLNLQDVTRQQATLRELEHRAFQLQKLTLELSQAEDRERRRLAEVLHDGLQQQLAAAKFHLGLLSNRAKADAGMQEIAGQLDKMLRDAIEQSRSLSHELSPAVLYQSDLGETFEWLARQVQNKHGLVVHTEVHGRVDSQSESIKAFLFRAGQEILFNAVKHAKVTEARLRLQRRSGCLWLTIGDRGRGFNPSTVSRAAGFGLLSIRERVGLLGGRMKIRSVLGKGSVFLITVPDASFVEAGQAKAEAKLAGERAAPRSPVSSAVRPSILRVLLVDDHKVMREGLAALIAEQKDMEIVGQAGDGREAVELAETLEPDVIIMDVAMPVMNGEEATRRIKTRLPQTRVVALSMFEEPGVREKMLDAGAEIYLPKTGPSEGFLAAIRG
jgi:PAS domain S-box-containing protein